MTNNSLEVSTSGTLTVGAALSAGAGGTFTANNGAVVTAASDLRVNSGGSATFDNATLTTDNIEVGFAGTTPGSLLAVVNGAVVNVNQGVNVGAGTVFVGGTSDGTLRIGQGGTAGTVNAATVDLGSAGSKAVFEHTGTTTFAPAIINLGQVEVNGPGTTILTGANTYSGATQVLGGTLQAGALNVFGNLSATTVAGGATLDLNGFNQTLGSLAGVGGVTLGAASLTAGGNDATTTFSGAIAGTGGLTKAGLGTLTLSGANTYSGATTVNAGTLLVNGSIVNSAATVNAGGTLGGTGTFGNTAIAGGTLAPGASIGTTTVQGTLTFQAGSTYLVEVSPSAADRTDVTGAATLAGTVQAVFQAGAYVPRSYTILSAAGGLGGTTFSGLTTVNRPNFNASLSYTNTDAILTLTAALGTASGLDRNQQNVANVIDTSFNSGGTLPPGFATVAGLTGSALGNALSQLSGEAAAGAQQGAFQLTGQFLGVMLDPFMDGRGGMGGAAGPALGFASEREALPKDAALAYAKAMKAPVVKARPSFEQRWTPWGGAFGGYNRTNGDPAVAGSHDLTARAAGFAAGLNHRVAPGTALGFALAGGGTNWSLAQGLGGGKSYAFQAGMYAATRSGPAYLAASLAFTNHWISTDRFAALGDHLTASFNAQSIGGRIEGGYRFGIPARGVTPYAALQAQGMYTPSYSETDISGGGFALTYSSRTATHVRSEVGARFDHVAAADSTAVLTLRGRLAWAHDWFSDPALTAVFQALPGASFTVNGATPPKDIVLASAGAELRLANGVMLSAKFEGEFASNAQTYAGTGALRVNW